MSTVTTKQYIANTWQSRYFWWHLALSDIRFRFRRSYLGIVWAILNPLLLTLLLTVVMSFVFKSQPMSYAVYVFCGLVVWEVITNCGYNGCDQYMKAERYIKQFKHPMLIYALRTTIVAMIYMMFGQIGLLAWIAIANPSHLIMTAIFILPAMMTLCFIALPVSLLCGMVNTKFRDFSQLLKLIFQAVWYASPIFISADVLLRSRHLYVLVTYNPIYHLLQLFRAPMLHGQAPTLTNFAYAYAAGLVIWALAIRSLVKNEKKLIHYL